MPSSYHNTISKILDLIIHLDPKSVLDIGVGFGKYGMLCREYLEVWGNQEEYGRFRRRIDGIEAFPRYLTPLHRYVYDEIFTGDARTVAAGLERRYDLVLLVDVLEHFEKDEGAEFVRGLLRRHGGVLISTPREFIKQHDAFDNPFETHRSHWSRGDLRALGGTLFLGDPDSWIVLVTGEERARELRRSYRMLKTKVRLARFPFVLAAYHLIRRPSSGR